MVDVAEGSQGSAPEMAWCHCLPQGLFRRDTFGVSTGGFHSRAGRLRFGKLACQVLAILITSVIGLAGEAQGETLAPEVERAIHDGLQYLATHQAGDGSWKTETKGSNQMGLMGLAILAFMANGHIGDGGSYADTTNRGIDYLVRQARPNGLLNIASSHYDMYNHGLATLALIEAYGMTGDPEVRRVLDKAVDLIVRCQGPEGGWTYSATRGTHDSSISVMQLLALRAARSVGFAIDAEVINRAHAYVRSCYRGKRFGYQPGGGGASYALTASGTVSLLAAGRTAAVDPATAGGLESLTEDTRNQGVNAQYYFYATYYAALAAKLAGESGYQDIYPPIVRTLLQSQHADGSWRGGSTGRIMNTSVAVFVLSLPQDMLPLCYEETQ